MKNYFISLAVLFLSTGCFHQTVNSNDIYRAQTFCLEKGLQVVKISATFAGAEYVTCSDNKESQI